MAKVLGAYVGHDLGACLIDDMARPHLDRTAFDAALAGAEISLAELGTVAKIQLWRLKRYLHPTS